MCIYRKIWLKRGPLLQARQYEPNFLVWECAYYLGCENLYILHIVSKSVTDISKFLQKYQTKYQNSGKTVPLIWDGW